MRLKACQTGSKSSEEAPLPGRTAVATGTLSGSPTRSLERPAGRGRFGLDDRCYGRRCRVPPMPGGRHARPR